MKTQALNAFKFTISAVSELATLGGIKGLASSNTVKSFGGLPRNMNEMGKFAVDSASKISPDAVAKTAAVTAATIASTSSTASTVIAAVTGSAMLTTATAAVVPVLIVAGSGFAVYKIVEWAENN